MKLKFYGGKWCLLVNDGNTPVVDKTWWETYALAKEWSIRSGKNLTLIPVKTAETLCQKDKAFKEMMTKYWIWNAEIMKSCKNDEELKKKLKLKTKSVYQWSNDDGISSVWSHWHSGGGCFYADALRPSLRVDHGVAAFLVSKETGREAAVKTPKRFHDAATRRLPAVK